MRQSATGRKQREDGIFDSGESGTWPNILGGVVIAGCLVAIVLDLVGAGLSDRVGLVRDTISNLAAKEGNATPVDELADTGLYAFAAAVLATLAGLLRWRIERLDWKIGAGSLAVVAACVTLIAGYEAYSGGDGPVIHYRLVYALGAAFPVAVLMTAGQFYRINNALGIALYALGAIWVVAAPFLFVVPTAWDGAYERLLAALMLGWFATMGLMIWRDPDTRRHVPADERS
ncbi:DUF998 domain-containing protein [Erythrobacter sp.]|uniref:DUF998 domain-containing protein n=1 Tax=Erythrobacter sp. TaxID=1042 RepID=UPI001425CB9C|nr:DUF998 domain-containing protein [Erythrobacter sp.]QIQ85634.1 MAG: DUF998 domain-containing protein [Erythrobacter sp.]